MELDDETNAWLKRAQEGSEEKIKSSAVFMTLLSPGKPDPLMALQLGLAILYNKPIAVLALQDQKIPESLRNLSFFCEEKVTMENIGAATTRLMTRFDEIEGEE